MSEKIVQLNEEIIKGQIKEFMSLSPAPVFRGRPRETVKKCRTG